MKKSNYKISKENTWTGNFGKNPPKVTPTPTPERGKKENKTKK